MSGLIKPAHADARIARLPVAVVVDRAAPPPAEPPLDPRIARLEARVAELEQTLADERIAAERAVAAARVAGRGDAVADDAARTALVERGLADALAGWRDALAGIDRLAASLVAAALAKIFGDSPDLAAMTRRTLAFHIDRLDRAAVVEVRVSASDFSDEAALGALTRATGLPPVRVTTATELSAGACRVTLRLGEVELDPLMQWAAIDAALAELAAA